MQLFPKEFPSLPIYQYLVIFGYVAALLAAIGLIIAAVLIVRKRIQTKRSLT